MQLMEAVGVRMAAAGDSLLWPWRRPIATRFRARNVAYAFAEGLRREETIGQVIPLGRTETYSWRELYNTCRALIRGEALETVGVAAGAGGEGDGDARPTADGFGGDHRSAAALFRFDAGQVQMSQEDSICDPAIAETLFGVLRCGSFEGRTVLLRRMDRWQISRFPVPIVSSRGPPNDKLKQQPV